MHRLEDRVLFAEVRPGDHSETTHEAGRKIRHDVSVQVREQKYVERFRPHHKLHRRVVDDQLAVFDLREILRHLAATAQEESVRELHDVRLVHRRDFLAPQLARILEGRLRDPQRGSSRDHFESRDHVLHHFMLQAGVQVFGILSKNHHVDFDVGEARLHTRKRAHRAHVGKQVERLAQCDVHAGETTRDRGRHRAFQADGSARDGSDHDRRQHFPLPLDDLRVQIDTLPFDRYAHCIHGSSHRLRDFRSYAISRNQRHPVRHDYHCREWPLSRER